MFNALNVARARDGSILSVGSRVGRLCRPLNDWPTPDPNGPSFVGVHTVEVIEGGELLQYVKVAGHYGWWRAFDFVEEGSSLLKEEAEWFASQA